MQEGQELLDQLPQLPDLQCAGLLLAMCAAPRTNHALRTVPPTMVAPYANMHDDAIWDTLDSLLGGLSPDETASARALAELPASLGGPGLVSAQGLLIGRGGLTLCQSSASAFRPSLSPARTRSQKRGANQRALSPLQQRERSSKMRAGMCARSGGPNVLEGACSPRMRDTSLGDWPHGWQSHASRIRNLHFRERVFLPTFAAKRQRTCALAGRAACRGLADSGAH